VLGLLWPLSVANNTSNMLELISAKTETDKLST
jgi:hypothetical protein